LTSIARLNSSTLRIERDFFMVATSSVV